MIIEIKGIEQFTTLCEIYDLPVNEANARKAAIRVLQEKIHNFRVSKAELEQAKKNEEAIERINIPPTEGVL